MKMMATKTNRTRKQTSGWQEAPPGYSKKLVLELPALHPAQEQIKAEAGRFNVVDCARRWGKTFLGEDLATPPLLMGFPVGWFTKTYKLAEAVFKDFVTLLQPLIKYKDKNKLTMELITGGILECWSFEQEDIGRSRKYYRVILDECGSIPKLLDRFNAEIRPTLSDYRGAAWFLGTPKGKNDFYTLYERGRVGSPEKRKGWKSWQMPTSTNPYILPEEIADAKRDMPPGIFAQEYEASFIDGADSFVPAHWLEACVTYDNAHALRGFQSGVSPVIVGIDAGYSSDYFAINVVYRDWTEGFENGGQIAMAFEQVYQPHELRDAATGKPDFQKPLDYLVKLSQSQNVVAYVFDPFQLIHMAGEAQKKVSRGFFQEFNQGSDRALADSNLRGAIRDVKFRLSATLHGLTRQHILNAGCKMEANAEQGLSNKIRMIKVADEKKIDCAVATSMAVYAATELYNI